MGRAKLPEARIEPRGVDGHLAQLKAEARQHARTAGKVGVVVARVVGWTTFTAGTVALLVWLAPPPKNARLDEVQRIQADFQRYQMNMLETQRALDQWQHASELRLFESTRAIQLPTFEAIPARPLPSYDWKRNADFTIPAFPDPSTSYPLPSASKAERAEARAAAVEANRAAHTGTRAP
ncbi:MAG TPA: hypothetical protein VM261_33010 [Kofleriaceae bacterium]|nr:hypothetical protein [Kofleriaceae bacterium]